MLDHVAWDTKNNIERIPVKIIYVTAEVIVFETFPGNFHIPSYVGHKLKALMENNN